MKNGILIATFNDMSGSYTCQRIIEECRNQDMGIVSVGIMDSLYADGLVCNENLPSHYDYVINRYKLGHIKNILNSNAEKQYNNISRFNEYVDKFNQYKLLSHYLSMPQSILARASCSFEKITDMVGLPFVSKGLDKSCGNEIFLIETKRQYLNLIATYGSEKEWVFQKYVAESRGKDIRIFSLRGKILSSMIRQNDDDFRSNYALGSKLKKCEITHDMKTIAEMIYEITGLDFVGIDLLLGKNELLLCEINVMPGLKGVESISNTNIAKKCIELIKND